MAQRETVTVSSLHVYPVKSCAGVELQQARVTPTGFLLDRVWMVVMEETGRFVSQRKEPTLALVQPVLPQEVVDAQAGAPLPQGLSLTLTAPGMSPLKVPLEASRDSPRRQCICWEWTGPAADAGDEAAAWLSDYLGKPVRLVRYAGRAGGKGAAQDALRRATDADWAPESETAFADGFPFLLIGEGSLKKLNEGMAEPVPMNRFRPNIVVSGAPGWTEDAWRHLSIGGVAFEAVKPCSRCKETTVDQEKATFGEEPLQTLRTFRTGTQLGWAEAGGLRSWKHEVFFGQNLITPVPEGTVKVGQTVEVATTRDTSTTSEGRALLWQPIPVPPPPAGLALALRGGQTWLLAALGAVLVALLLQRYMT